MKAQRTRFEEGVGWFLLLGALLVMALFSVVTWIDIQKIPSNNSLPHTAHLSVDAKYCETIDQTANLKHQLPIEQQSISAASIKDCLLKISATMAVSLCAMAIGYAFWLFA